MHAPRLTVQSWTAFLEWPMLLYTLNHVSCLTGMVNLAEACLPAPLLSRKSTGRSKRGSSLGPVVGRQPSLQACRKVDGAVDSAMTCARVASACSAATETPDILQSREAFVARLSMEGRELRFRRGLKSTSAVCRASGSGSGSCPRLHVELPGTRGRLALRAASACPIGLCAPPSVFFMSRYCISQTKHAPDWQPGHCDPSASWPRPPRSRY